MASATFTKPAMFADYEVAGLTIFGGSIPRIFVDGSHNVTETLIDFLAWPGQPHGILGHLKAGNRDAARICGLARAVENFLFQKQVNGGGNTRHIGRFRHEVAAVVK